MTDENNDDETDQMPDKVIELRPFRTPATWTDVVESIERVYDRMTEIMAMVNETRAELKREKGKSTQFLAKFGSIMKDDTERVQKLELQIAIQQARISEFERLVRSDGGAEEKE